MRWVSQRVAANGVLPLGVCSTLLVSEKQSRIRHSYTITGEMPHDV